MTSVTYTLEITEGIMALARIKAKNEYIGRSTALRQMLRVGAEKYVLSLIEKGRLSTGRVAELLKISIRDIHEIAQKRNVQIGANPEQQRESEKTLKMLLNKEKRSHHR